MVARSAAGVLIQINSIAAIIPAVTQAVSCDPVL
jgi:hypothetical protein